MVLRVRAILFLTSVAVACGTVQANATAPGRFALAIHSIALPEPLQRES